MRVSQQQLSAQLNTAASSQQDNMQTELASKAADISVIKTHIVSSQDNILRAISELEAQAEQNNVTIQVPSVTEESYVDKSGQPIKSHTGPIKDIRITIVAQGAPEHLITYLHHVEYSHYALNIDNWQLITNAHRQHNDSGLEIPHLAELQLELLLPLAN